jgi:CelD/BcsL family acetyltransferase involved in cellulose biosynthesis
VPLQALVFHPDLTSLIGSSNTREDFAVEFSPGVDTVIFRSWPVTAQFPKLTLTAQAIRYVREQYDHCYIHLEGSFSDYLQQFSSKTRSTLQRKVRKFAEFSGGTISWREFSSPEQLAEFQELARVISTKTYQERLLRAGLPKAKGYWDALLALAQEDSVRGWILFHHEGTPVAYLLSPARNGTLFYDHLGYDPQYTQWSPGVVLQYLVLERLFAERRFRYFDFGQGEGTNKRFFARGTVPCAEIYYFRRTVRNLLLVATHIGLNVFSSAIGRLLQATGLKARVRAFLSSISPDRP